MTGKTGADDGKRAPLSAERILRTAVLLADERGIGALTMRGLADRLGVEAMSLYHHVPNKAAVLDGIVDAVFAEIELPSPGADWRTAMRDRAFSAHAALTRHRWAIGLLDSRARPGPATLRHHDAVIGALRRAGFPSALAAHALSAIDSYVYGFVLQEASLPFDSASELATVAGDMLDRMPADTYPHLAEMITEQALKPGGIREDAFGFGLDLLLDGLERRHRAQPSP
ncbi:TetR/AcrR family transcriptional regulator C-terminal domain-containing protein [Streptomyces sp. ST2-7A]|uniref:TetR/AcrR family transcriptional regulator C-terminal domain-containing protein n=1 Tax=Streptomyces sp. ST2-7A TaxID=2907214 RepID=UPI001F1C07B4|nr:TetR/AcrR family transcriptional regulator C-terminal domain-containing protein [Streptomyces sp. ST2-7A]MCE7080345.1 TetR/AcrR family transcriptional regulator C-terminal domain-containing protein [Streptomyces sp. ST2-7A]